MACFQGATLARPHAQLAHCGPATHHCTHHCRPASAAGTATSTLPRSSSSSSRVYCSTSRLHSYQPRAATIRHRTAAASAVSTGSALLMMRNSSNRAKVIPNSTSTNNQGRAASVAAMTAAQEILLPALPETFRAWQAARNTASDKRMQAVLVATLGSLNDVWNSKQQQEELLSLPLPAMQLLLQADQLTVDSEDTVYYTAAQYVKRQPEASRGQVISVLAPLIRCPQLSHFCLSNVALTTDASLLLNQYKTQLRQLLSATAFAGEEQHARLIGLLDNRIPDTPSSWKLPARSPTMGVQPPVADVSMVWQLNVDELKQACRSSKADATTKYLYAPSSPPRGGSAWLLYAYCDGKAAGTVIGLYVRRADAPPGTYAAYRFTIAAPQAALQYTATAIGVKDRSGWGRRDFFKLGPMSGGWNEAAWADKGLPTSGNLELKLTVHSIGTV